MKLSVAAGEVSLPEDFSFDIESNHPFFSDEGTSSVPVTIPASRENLSLLGYPENKNRTKRYEREQSAFLQAGLFRERCSLITESAARDSGVSASLAFLESRMYADLQERRLPDIFLTKGFAITKLTYCLPWDIYKGTAYNGPEDVAIFPVATDMDSDGNVFVLNNPRSSGFDDGAREEEIGGESVQVPAGYGIAIFIYLWALVEYTFTLSGYTIKSNCIKTDPMLKYVVAVNNYADVCCISTYSTSLWGFNYGDIVPDITVGELVRFLHDAFGVYVAVNDRIVEIRFIKDDLTAAPDGDISGYVSDDETVSYPEPYRIERSFDTSIELAEPAAETLADLRSAHSVLTSVVSEAEILGSGLFFVRPLGRYFFKASSSSSRETLGSDCFRYFREFEMDSEELSCDNRFLPMIKVGTRYMPYIGERHHKYTEAAGEDGDFEQPLQLCYAHFYGEPGTGNFCGSSYGYYENGAQFTPELGSGDSSRMPLTPEGLFKYWKDYETLAVNGAPEITVTLNIPVNVFLSMDRFAPKIYRGCKVLIKSMKYSVGNADILQVETNMLLLATYDDAVYIPATIMFNIAYGWELVSTKDIPDYFTGVWSDGLEDYTDADAPGTTPSRTGIIAKKRKRYAIAYRLNSVSTFWTFEWEEYFISVAEGQ